MSTVEGGPVDSRSHSQTMGDLLYSLGTEEKDRQMENARFVEEQQIRKSLAPAQWERLTKELEEHCSAIAEVSPARLRFESDSALAAGVRNLRTGHITQLRYDPAVPCIHYSTPQQRGHLAFRVSTDGTGLQFIDDGTPRLVDEIAVRLIRSLL